MAAGVRDGDVESVRPGLYSKRQAGIHGVEA